MPTKRPSRAAALAAVRTLISYIGDDPARIGVIDTPDRFLKAWEQDWGKGYDPVDGMGIDVLLKTFPGPSKLDVAPMVVVKDIQFYSTCEHHLAPFFGTVTIGYIPSYRGIVGLSKLARAVDYFSRRLQVQERMTDLIADLIALHLSDDCAVVVEATHMCMVSRGVKQPNAVTITSALRGAFYNDLSCRNEFFGIIRGR